MDIFFSALACSMSSRIAVYEAGSSANFIEIDPKTKKTLNGEDYLAINPLGLVPALRTSAGLLLTENSAVLQYIADQYPAAGLAPSGGWERSKLQQWLSFISTELHKALFVPLFDRTLADESKQRILDKGDLRLNYLNRYLAGREFLLDQFSVADAYLFTVLNWKTATPVDLTKYSTVESYYERLKQRPALARALMDEHVLYAAQIKRHKAA